MDGWVGGRVGGKVGESVDKGVGAHVCIDALYHT